jgi:signal transduction histidine kinase
VSTAGVLLAIGVGACSALAGGLVLRQSLQRIRRLRWQVLVVTLSSLVGGAIVASVLARQMVLDSDQLRTVIAVLAATGAFATVLVVTSTSTLGRDVQRLERAVRAVEGGDRSVRTGVRRADELGHVAAALDDAVTRLEQLEHERAAGERQREELFASISHDLRTPLAALRAAVEAMEDGITPDPQRYLRSMARDVDALALLIDDLFLLSRIETGSLDMPRSHVDLAELADEAAEALTPVAASHRVTLEVEASAGGALALGNPTALGRVIRNLLDNAIRHSPPGSTVHVVVTCDGRPTVRVRDHGAGFPRAFTERAFERFSRADASRSRGSGGAGLGLAIARGLVDAHGGDIWIDGDADAGASVAFALPVPTA